MASKILSFICHVPTLAPGSYPAVPTTATPSRTIEPKKEVQSTSGGHFAAIYENDRFVRFKYINNTK
ncbi:hypothetical protein H8B15_12540 [Hymenobacter sp. BT507]|uniref:Uncharacterized protein n=1 Tax=Hymenobacter citatus TaxID=2763506 RepID=A0ABR7MLY5_9BACT|nr:hypothetical protein [Hymenobacter citatus]MBC6611755.1 hypothetical protein [Hymenobacter citatus]